MYYIAARIKLEWGWNQAGIFGITILGRAVQLCPDQQPAVSSMALWGSVQSYPACAVASEFADAGSYPSAVAK